MSSAPAPLSRSRAMTGREWGMLFFLALLWGGSYLFNGLIVREVPVLTTVSVRLLLASVAMVLFLRLSGRKLPLDRTSLFVYLGMGLLNSALPFCLIVFGQTRIAAGLAAIINAMTPIFTMLLAHIFLSTEKLDLRRSLGVVLGFCGVVVLFWSPQLLQGSELLGMLACLLATVSYGFSNNFGKVFIPKGADPIAVATGQVCAAALLILPFAVVLEAPFSRPLPSVTALGALVAIALVSTALAYTLYYRILTGAGATNASLVTLLVPCSAIVLSALFLNEALHWREAVGFAIIASGLLVIDGRVLGKMRKFACKFK